MDFGCQNYWDFEKLVVFVRQSYRAELKMKRMLQPFIHTSLLQATISLLFFQSQPSSAYSNIFQLFLFCVPPDWQDFLYALSSATVAAVGRFIKNAFNVILGGFLLNK